MVWFSVKNVGCIGLVTDVPSVYNKGFPFESKSLIPSLSAYVENVNPAGITKDTPPVSYPVLPPLA